MFGLLLHQRAVRLPSCVPAGAGKVTFIMYYMAPEISCSAVHLQQQMCCGHSATWTGELKGERRKNPSAGAGEHAQSFKTRWTGHCGRVVLWLNDGWGQ